MHTIRSFSGPANKDDTIEDPDVSGSERSFSNDGVRHGRDDDSDSDDDSDQAFIARPALSGADPIKELDAPDLQARLLIAETAQRVAEVILSDAEADILHLKHNVHDANNALVGAMGYLDLALMGDLNEKVRADLATAFEEMKRVAALIKRTMDKTGELKINKEPVELSGLIGAVLKSAKPFLKDEMSVCFVQDVQAVVDVDILNLHSVLLNLVKNAAEALNSDLITNPSPKITVFFYVNGDHVKIEIIDNGPGIPVNIRERVFEEKGFTTKGNKGNGLGLPMAKKIIEAHGGKLLVDSVTADEGEETGTKFSIILPLSTKE